MLTKTLPAIVALMLASPALAAGPDSAGKIRDVETGLSNAVSIAGEAPVRRTIEQSMALHHVPGVSVAVIDHGKVVWSKAWGVITAGQTAPVTPETRFQAASISKTLAAGTTLGLVVEGRINLDAPVNAALKGWALPVSDIAPGYIPSVRALLSHSGGTSVHGFGGYAVDAPIPTLVQVLDGISPANSAPVRIDHKPGVWQYSGGGTTIVQKLVQDVTGQAFADVVRARVIVPVGMGHSTYAIPAQGDSAFATAHHGDGTPVAGRWHIYPEAAAAGLWTTPGDLAKWALAVARAAQGDASGGVDPRVAKLLLEPQPGLDTGGGAMGLGFFLNRAGAPASFGHGGANEGFRSQLTYYPGTGQGVAIMTNSDAGGTVQNEIERAVARAYGWPGHALREVRAVQPDATTLQAMIGAYRFETVSNAITIKLNQGAPVATTLWDGRGKSLVAVGPASFIDAEDGTTYMPQPDGSLVVEMAGGNRLVLHK